MRRTIILALLALAGCANLTPEQRQALNAHMAQVYQQQYEAQMAQINAAAQANAARSAGQVNCTTTYSGNQAFTHCQ